MRQKFLKRAVSVFFIALLSASFVVSAGSATRSLSLRGDGTVSGRGNYFSLVGGESASCTATYSTYIDPNTSQHKISATLYLRRYRWYGYEGVGHMIVATKFPAFNYSSENYKTASDDKAKATFHPSVTNGSYYFVVKFSGSTTAYCNTVKATITQ